MPIKIIYALALVIGVLCFGNSTDSTSTHNLTQEKHINTTHIKLDTLYSNYDINYYKYFLVMGAMFALLLVLYVIRLRQGRGAQVSNILIEQSRILDSKNRIVVITYEHKKYILGLNPNGITLIDKVDTKNDNFLDLMKSEDNESGDSKV